MSNYTPSTDFSVKDGLTTGDPEKVILGADFDVEFDAIQAAIASKEDTANKGAASGYASLDSGTKVPVAQLPAATETAVGVLEIATAAEAEARSADDKIITPLKLNEVLTDTAGSINVGTIQVNGTAVALQSTTVSAGTGLTGGGTLAANRTLSLDISGLTAIDVAGLAATDGVLIDDGGVMKRMAVQSMGTRVEASATQTLALDDSGKLFVNTGASEHAITVPTNASVAFPVGAEFGFLCQSTGKIAIVAAGGVTIVSLNSNKDVKASGGAAYLVKIATDLWHLAGDLEA